jgi:HEXXH motif-containing protein
MTTDLVERVKQALKDPSECPWLPGLVEELVDVGWRDLYWDLGILPSNYGTARVIARDASVPRRIAALKQIDTSNENHKYVIQVEILGEEIARRYEESGIKFYTAEEISCAMISKRVEEAINLLKVIPTLFATVALLVKSVHLIDVEDDDYDASFSEPHIPFSIFISVPRRCNLISHLRIAEAIVHEAMHLQLTLIEKIVPLVTTSQNKYFSPWRGEYRNAQGVIHALYVFRVIDGFLKRLPISSYSNEEGEYVKNRRAEIHTQIHEIQSFQDFPALTREGSNFVRGLVLK